jgi:NADH dehydrogenase
VPERAQEDVTKMETLVRAPAPSGRRVLIVGGGFGGLNAAKHLCRREGLEVLLIDRENHHLFQPLLYQIATAALSAGSIAVPIRSVVGASANERVLLGEVVGIDTKRRVVKLEDGAELSYDYLIIAAGAETNYFGNDAWSRHAFGLKDLRDAIRIRERILLAFAAAEREPDPDVRRRLLSFVVIGGGPTGVEMAGAISELARLVLARDYQYVHSDEIRVTLIEMADRILMPFDASLAAAAEKQLEELGVDIRTGLRVTDVPEGEVHAGGEVFPAAVVVWASGVKPVSLASKVGAPLDRTGRLKVDAFCNVEGHPEVFAIGDIASFVPEGETRPLPGLAPVAIQQGRYVARTIRGDVTGKARKPFHYRDKGIMTTIGRSRAVVESGALKLSGFLAWLMWCFVHVAYLIGFRNRIVVMFEWAWQYVTFKRGARLITARHTLEPHWMEESAIPDGQAAVLHERDDDAPEVHASPSPSRPRHANGPQP